MIRIPIMFMILGTILLIAGKHLSDMGLTLSGSVLIFSGTYYCLKILNILYERYKNVGEINL